MRYILIDTTGVDMFTEEFETKEEAIEKADREWDRMTGHDQERRTAFYVIESANPDEDAPEHFDGNVVKEYK